jgi:hypothetical protein
MIDHDNLEEFEEPALYDAENGAFEPEGPFYLALAKRHGGPVLDLACGTGIIHYTVIQSCRDLRDRGAGGTKSGNLAPLFQ